MTKKTIPTLSDADYKTSYFEFWATWLFYFPMKVYGSYLAIKFRSLTVPTISNPSFDAGGFAGESKSQILDLVPQETQQYFARHKVTLDNILTEGEIFRIAFAGSHTWGTIFKNGGHLTTPEMTSLFDKTSKSIPKFYFGRYDVKFKSFSDLEDGKNIKIIEINGAISSYV